MLNILKNTINRVFASGVDSDASAFITATGLSSTTQKSAITTLVKDLKSSGLWSKMKAVYPMVTDIRNFTSYSEDFSDGSWTKGNSTITTNSTTAPNGTLTADSLVENTLNATHLVSNTTAITTTANDHTLSVYAKKANRDWLYLNLYNGTTSLFAWFNLNTGAVGTVQSGLTAAIQDVGNGWYRLSVTRTLPSTVNCFIQYGSASADNTTTFVGNGLVAAYLWGAQLELGSTASAYQPILTTPSAYMASQMKYNLKDARDLDAAFRLTWSGGWTYSATGATPNGTNAYADTKLNLLSNLSGYDSSFSVYYRQDLYGTYKVGALGTTFNEGMSAHLGWTNTSGTLYNDHLGRNTIINNVYGTFNAYHISTVTSTASQKLFRNGVLKVSGAATSGITMPSLNFYFGAANQNGTANYFDPKQIAFGTLSNGLTDTEAILLNQIVEKYQVALSRGVQAAQSFYYNSAYSNEANTYLYSTQITGTTQVSAINTLINGLKANNLWSKMKAVYPFVTDYRNLLGYTEDYSNAVWSKNNSSIAVNQIAAPNGTLTGNGLVDNATNAGHSFNNATGITVTANNYTLSVYAKKGNKDWIYLNIYNGTNDAFAWFNLNTGITGTVQSGLTSSIQDAGNGWYRVSITRNLPVTSNCYVQYGASNTDNSTTFVGTGTYNIYLWGTQFELGALSNYQQVLTTSANYMSNQMKFNLVNPQDSDAAFRLAFSGGWTYSTNGAQPNGTNGYADTKLNPSTVFGTNYASQGAYYRETFTLGQLNILGVSTATQRFDYGFDNGYLTPFCAIGSVSAELGVDTDNKGFTVITRQGASLVKFFRNGVVKINGTQPFTSYPAFNYFISARNNSGTPVLYGNTKNIAFQFICDSLNDTEANLFYQLVQQFQTDLSRQV